MSPASVGEKKYPADLEEYVTLPNLRRVRIRSLHANEYDPICELYRQLSPRTRYLRFFSDMPVLPESVMRLLVGANHRRQLALVAQYEESGDEHVIGLGSFGAIDDCTVEIGLVVRDDWQRQRVGTALANRLFQMAEHRGFHRFVGHVLSGNEAIRKFLKNLAVIVSAKVTGGVSELVFVRRSPALIHGERRSPACN